MKLQIPQKLFFNNSHLQVAHIAGYDIAESNAYERAHSRGQSRNDPHGCEIKQSNC